MESDTSPRPIVLASGSPRRREILATLGIPFETAPVDIDERPHPGEPPAATALRLACEKAAAVHADHPGRMLLAADTLVVVDGEPLGKPASPEAAAGMLRRLSGQAHHVVTGIALLEDGRVHADVDRTDVWVRSLSNAEIDAYVATGEPLDRAGAYAIQGRGAALVERIDGDFHCVMGLSVRLLLRLLSEAGRTYRP